MDTDDASDLLVRWLKAREYAYTLGVALQLVYDEQIAERRKRAQEYADTLHKKVLDAMTEGKP